MKIQDVISKGIQSGVKRHFRYTKNLYKIKPEYLLTVSIADELSNGFEEIGGLDIEIQLEEPTREISGKLLAKKIGYKKYFESRKKHKVGRPGKVDICIESDSNLWIIEIKGFDPSKSELKKEIKRLTDFLTANEGINSCKNCILAFPTKNNKKEWIEKCILNSDLRQDYNPSIKIEKIETNVNDEDGMSEFFTNCITFTSVKSE